MTADTAPSFKAHVISLPRTPQRLDRFRQWNEPSGIHFEVLKAVDGRALMLKLVDQAVLRPGTVSYTAGSVGSALSHRMLWQWCASGETPFLICEDDAALRADARSTIPALMARLPADWEMICLGYNPDTLIEVEVGAGIRLRFGFPGANPAPEQLGRFVASATPIGAARLLNFFGLCAYVLSPAGAKRLLDLCFPLDDRSVVIQSLDRRVGVSTLDGRINCHLAEIGAYAAIPPIALPDNHSARSAKAAPSR
jgi:glycosyl transferase, family 25